MSVRKLSHTQNTTHQSLVLLNSASQVQRITDERSRPVRGSNQHAEKRIEKSRNTLWSACCSSNLSDVDVPVTKDSMSLSSDNPMANETHSETPQTKKERGWSTSSSVSKSSTWVGLSTKNSVASEIPVHAPPSLPASLSEKQRVQSRSSIRSLKRVFTMPVRKRTSSLGSMPEAKTLNKSVSATVLRREEPTRNEMAKAETTVEPQTPLGLGADIVFGAVADLTNMVWSSITGQELPFGSPIVEEITEFNQDTGSASDRLLLRITSDRKVVGSVPSQVHMRKLLEEERRSYLIPQELEQEKRVKKELGDDVGMYDELCRTYQMNIVRGFEDLKSKRVPFQANTVKSVVKWRKENDVDNLFRAPLPDQDIYYKLWPTSYCGTDGYGHQILVERIQDINIDELFKLGPEKVLELRTQMAEGMFVRNKLLSERGPTRVSRHIYILDLKGLSLSKHFDSKTRNFLPPLFKLTGDMYPNGLWSLHIVNVPVTFRIIWNVIQPLVDKKVKEKIHLHSNTNHFLSYCDANEISRENIPTVLGGRLTNAIPFEKVIDQLIDEEYPAGLPQI